jgi:hypothetical protein
VGRAEIGSDRATCRQNLVLGGAKIDEHLVLSNQEACRSEAY